MHRLFQLQRKVGSRHFHNRVWFEHHRELWGLSTALQILILLTVLTLAPAILILMTSFTRIVVSLSFIRNAIATNQMPPNQVLIGLALFLTFFIMAPVFMEAYTEGISPYLSGEIDLDTALTLPWDRSRIYVCSYQEKDCNFLKLLENQCLKQRRMLVLLL